MVSRILTSTSSSAAVQRQNCRQSTLHHRSWRPPRPKAHWLMGRRPSCKATRACEMNHFTPLRLPKGCQVYRREHCDWTARYRSRIVSQLKEEGYETNMHEPCLFSKCAVRDEPGGRWRNDRTGRVCRLRAARSERPIDGWSRKGISCQHGGATAKDLAWKVAPVVAGRAVLFSEDAILHSCLIEVSRLT